MKYANHRYTRQKHNHQIVEVEKKVFEPKLPYRVGEQKAPGLTERFLILSNTHRVKTAMNVSSILTGIAIICFLIGNPFVAGVGRFLLGYAIGRMIVAYAWEAYKYHGYVKAKGAVRAARIMRNR